MREAGIGRVLVASLHQGIADILPTRLGFYENWLNAEGLREGTIGLAPLYAVLSFLRQEGDAYQMITSRAGEYAAEWTVASMPAAQRTLIKAAPAWLRGRLILRLARRLVRQSFRGNRAISRLRKGTASVEVRGSIFCTVREPTPQPLCGFYAAALTRLMTLFSLTARAEVVACRGTGEPTCLLKVAMGVMLFVLAASSPEASTPSIHPPASQSEPAGRVLVMPFDNVKREGRIFWMSEASAVLLSDNLQALGVDAIPRDERHRAIERLQVPHIASLTDATIIRIGQVVGAAVVVVGSLQLEGDTLSVRARSIALDTGRIQATVTESGPLPQLFAIFERVARQLAPPSNKAPEDILKLHPPVAAFEDYIKGLLAETPGTAVSYLKAALSVHPPFDRVRLALWDVHTEQGDHQQALAAVQPVTAASSLARAARFRGGLSQLSLKRYDDAFATFRALADADPVATVMNNLGIVQILRGGTPQSGQPAYFFTKAADSDPGDPDYFFNLGYAYWLERDLQAAIYWLREALRRDPTDGEAHYVLGTALAAGGGSSSESAREKELARRLSSTFEEWDKRPAADPVPKGLERLKADIDVPRRSATVATEQRDQLQLVQFYLDRGRRLYEQDNDRDAIVELNRALFLSPYQPEAHLLLGRIRLRGGQVQDAIDALKISLWSEETVEAHIALGEAYLQLGDLTGARQEAERALAMNPKASDAQQLLDRTGPRE